uniref:Uncharacterized protein n=1 Tax=Arundo donax TaxID=35708 RepID=A0A0A9H9B0_ARUDO
MKPIRTNTQGETRKGNNNNKAFQSQTSYGRLEMKLIRS